MLIDRFGNETIRIRQIGSGILFVSIGEGPGLRVKSTLALVVPEIQIVQRDQELRGKSQRQGIIEQNLHCGETRHPNGTSHTDDQRLLGRGAEDG